MGLKGVFYSSNYIDALSFAPGLNLTDLEALILIFSPVCGLMPLRAALFTIEKVPKPII